MDVISEDKGITENTLLYIQSDGVPLSVSDILLKKRFELQPFLIGILHFVLMHRTDNIFGQATLEKWGIKKSERSERKLRDDFSLGVSRTAEVDWLTSDDIKQKEPAITADNTTEQQAEEYETVDAETVSAQEETQQQGNVVNQTLYSAKFMNFGNGVIQADTIHNIIIKPKN